MATCPVDGCEQIKEHVKELFGRDGLKETLIKCFHACFGELGQIDRITALENCVKKKVSSTSIRVAIYASLTILMASFGTLASMWAQTKDVPDMKVFAQETRTLARDTKERIAVGENQMVNLQDDIKELKAGQTIILQSIQELLKK